MYSIPRQDALPPASGSTCFAARAGRGKRLLSVTTNGDGRVDAPLLADDAFTAGRYELVFHAAAYLRAGGTALPDTPFLDEIVIAFGIDNADQHYHVPLLLSPYGYSTYRGS